MIFYDQRGFGEKIRDLRILKLDSKGLRSIHLIVPNVYFAIRLKWTKT